MTRDETVAEFKSWSAADRLALLDELWTSLDQDDLAPALTPEVHSLLDERIAHADAHPEDVMTWQEMKAELRHERGRA